MAILEDLCKRLTENPPRLPPWIFVPTTSIPPVLGAIHYWIESSKTTSTETALKLHKIPDLSASTPPGTGTSGPLFPNPENAMAYGEKIIREVLTADLEGMTGQRLIQLGVVPGHLSSSQARQYFERHKSKVIDDATKKMKASIPSASTDVEVKWYTLTKTLPIPKGLEERHTALKQLLDVVRQNKDIPRVMVTKVFPPSRCSACNSSPSLSWTGTTGDRNDVEAQHNILCTSLSAFLPVVFNKIP